MTNAHVIDGATTVKVTVEIAGKIRGQQDSSRVYNARIMGVDHDTDPGAAQIDAAKLPSLNSATPTMWRREISLFAIGSRLRLPQFIVHGCRERNSQGRR